MRKRRRVGNGVSVDVGVPASGDDHQHCPDEARLSAFNLAFFHQHLVKCACHVRFDFSCKFSFPYLFLTVAVIRADLRYESGGKVSQSDGSA
ncbi:hypothetical protein E2C01_096309 [Portunus trituberculatus]|uniref:Uncharacterized protein n=1 Tax=Portunus trituberculatus TaxID=210409 RepID=A0A5B7K1E5_PORTR|nr:hypothetical protein [Portunus trituberculatus]